MSGSRAAAGAGASSSGGIPSNARKVVLQLKEVVQGTDDEIYAMLRDCNMDPNETVQRLLNQDPFHEVKRKKDKKKDGVGSKDSTENRSRPANGGPSSRGGRSGLSDRGAGRGNGGPRYLNDYNSGGRGRQFVAVPRENGTHQNSRGSGSAAPGVTSTSFSYGQQKLSSIPASASATLPSTVSSAGPAPAPVSAPSSVALPAPSPTSVPSSSLANGSSLYSRPSPGAQGSWGGATGHATMADIVKSNGGAPSAPASVQPSLPTVSQLYVPVQSAGSVSSGVYSSSTDPVLHPGLDPRATGAPGAIKRELGSVGNQRPIGDRPSVSVVVEGNSVSSPSHQAHLPSSSPGGLHSLEAEVQELSPASPSSGTVAQERAVNVQSGSSESVSSALRQPSGPVSNASASPATRIGLGGGQLNSRLGYQGQQQPVGTQKSTGSGLEWKRKPSVNVLGGPTSSAVAPSTAVATSEASTAPTAQDSTSAVSSASAKLQGLNIQDDQQVIIPNHLQVTEADRTRLSFGSFGAGFGTSYSSSFVADEPSKIPLPAVEAAPLVEAPVEQPSTSASSAAQSQVYVHQTVSSPLESLVSSNDVAVSAPTPAAPQLELSKPDPIVQPGQYPYLPAVASYPGFGIMPHMHSPQYGYDPADTQQQDVSRLPNLMAYTDPTTSYYAPFRPGTDADTRYPPFLTSNATSKFNGNIGLQSLQSSQEGSNSLAASGPSVQTSQTGNAPSAPVIPQQPLPIHPYQHAGVPLGFASVFGYQYGPSSYTYVHHPPYQHSYTSSSAYPQPPTGTGYPQAGGSNYTPGGAGTVKYPMPQYKPGNASGNVPHSAAASGYGGYNATPTGYAANTSVTAGSATVYEDVTGQPYKDNNLYIPSQQGEGSAVWIQTQLSRDMANAGTQTSSYYSMPTQGQHTGYSHSQQPTHAHAHPGAYGGLYHPSQSGPAPIAHQLLQQPQALGAGGGGGGQAGGYQQPQRTQPTWTNNY